MIVKKSKVGVRVLCRSFMNGKNLIAYWVSYLSI